MRIKITKPGIYNAKGEEIAVGTELTVKSEPAGWAGRYEVISGSDGDKTAVTNPKPSAVKAIHHGGGKFNVVDGDEVLLPGLSKADADSFNDMSDEDKAAYVAAEKAKA
jgi:hypothetical protein